MKEHLILRQNVSKRTWVSFELWLSFSALVLNIIIVGRNVLQFKKLPFFSEY